MRPFHVVEGDGFKKMVKALNLEYKVKTEKTYHAIVNKRYNELFPVVRDVVKKASYITLTCDFWSSIAKHSYVTVTAHWINDDFAMQFAVLCTEEMNESHTGSNIELH